MARSIRRALVRRACRSLVASLLAGAALGGCAWLLEDPGGPARPAGSTAPARRPPPSLHAYPWVWTDERGRAVRFSGWRGQPLVVTVAFTSCRETCPRTIRALRDLHARFQRERRAARFVIVTLDPRNDTPERLRQFKQTERLPEAWHLLVGSPSATQALSELLGVHVVDLEAHLMHDATVVLFDEQGRPTRSFAGWNLDKETALF
jgi:cytochrome oxidase Cu insertion factor (SCO1/SenC/PrrC family)